MHEISRVLMAELAYHSLLEEFFHSDIGYRTACNFEVGFVTTPLLERKLGLFYFVCFALPVSSNCLLFGLKEKACWIGLKVLESTF